MHYIMYVDESGDAGRTPVKGSSTDYFALTGLVFSIDNWAVNFRSFVELKKYLKEEHRLKYYHEIHAHAIVAHEPTYRYMALKRTDIIALLEAVLKSIAALVDVRVINIYFYKKKLAANLGTFTDFQEMAWNRLATRYQKFLEAAGHGEYGLIIPDRSREAMLTRALRKWRQYNPQFNPVTRRQDNIILDRIIEDPFFKDSNQTPFLQYADVACYTLMMREAVLRRGPGRKQFRRLKALDLFNIVKPICLKAAATADADGIVRR